ncbi:hypothetical protein OSH11_07820 [Kaistia dalseonensis]|uniref:Sulfur globule protein n=1 Tax=Kaistia dalseonensis TaxID=410840 RepID=A0ABU0H5Y7_9HYPH|nr:hypothetical protein [Kaistia dalseonensis]MCX5494605.1 hypothetical protein [Kaistia dalseonensis]MDQ0437185.1 hypothetical protein [Kaistia dalseonensis]
MLKTTLIAAATTLAIAAGSLTAMTGTASAQPYHNGPYWHGGGPGGPGWGHRPHRVCKPVFRSVKVRGYQGWYWKRVVVGERCFWSNGYRW